MELLSQLTWVDLALIFILAAGVFIGFTQGMIRYLLNCIAVLVAFVLASQLKGPLFDLLGSAPGDKRHAVFETGHAVPLSDVSRELLPFLDRYLGPVPRLPPGAASGAPRH